MKTTKRLSHVLSAAFLAFITSGPFALAAECTSPQQLVEKINDVANLAKTGGPVVVKYMTDDQTKVNRLLSAIQSIYGPVPPKYDLSKANAAEILLAPATHIEKIFFFNAGCLEISAPLDEQLAGELIAYANKQTQ